MIKTCGFKLTSAGFSDLGFSFLDDQLISRKCNLLRKYHWTIVEEKWKKIIQIRKSHEQIYHFIILYLVSLPPYLFRLMMNMSSGDPNKHDFSWKNKLSVVPLVSILTTISKLCLLATWIILSIILLSLTADSAPVHCYLSRLNLKNMESL